jgi:hypothetical protein
MQQEEAMVVFDRRFALKLGLTSAVAVPLIGFGSPVIAQVPKYGPTDGMDMGAGRRMIEVGEQESQITAYKGIKIIDIMYPVGAADPDDDPVMNVDMVCYIMAGEFRIQKTGIPPYVVKEGGVYTCGLGKKDKATNIGDVAGIHRITLLIPA